jgi:TonB family protein
MFIADMIAWPTVLSSRLIQKNLAKGLTLALALHFLGLLIWHLAFSKAVFLNFSESPRRVVPIELKPYAEIIRLADGGGQGGGEGGGSLKAPLPQNIPAVPVPVPDAVAPIDTIAMTSPVSPANDSANADGTGLRGSSWGTGGIGWGTGTGDGVGFRQIVQPRPIAISVPEYPPTARKAKIQGEIKLNVKVDETGKVVRVIVLSNTTRNEDCAQAAIAAAYRCRYHPAQTSAGPDTAWVIRQYRFSLDN